MFQPASLKGDSPTPIDERIRKKYLILYWAIILVSFVPCSLFEYLYVVYLWKPNLYWLFFLLLPFNAFLLIYILQISATVLAALILATVNVIHRPKEGVFRRDVKDKDYLFWNIRNFVKKWPLFVMATNPFPWFKNRFTLRFFGVKIGRRGIIDNSWISSEFVSIGRNIILGMGSTLLSFGFDQERFILKKIVVENDVIVGAKCVLLPGTIIKKGAKLSGHSYTNYDDALEADSLYGGHPAKLVSS